MVSVCLPSDALLQHLPSYLGFTYLGRRVSLHGCSSKAQPLLLTLDERYLLTATPLDFEHGIAPLGPSAPAQPPLLGCGVAALSAGGGGHVRGQGQRPRAPGCDGTGMAERSYPVSEARGCGMEEPPDIQGSVAVWAQEGLEEPSHVEGQEGQQ